MTTSTNDTNEHPFHDDIDLTHADIQSLSNADEVTRLFTRLRYNTDARIEQSLEALGFSTEGLRRAVQRIERIAHNEDAIGLFEVYLFEVRSLTTALRSELVQQFRDRGGDYLLVLAETTKPYERLDFVLVERYNQVITTADETLLVQPLPGNKAVRVRPRVLQVERLKPDAVTLRVLRRFTYTEGDIIAQYEKLLNAYVLATWSELYFNNRALFSDYYLLNRLPERDMWKGTQAQAEMTRAYKQLRLLYEDARDDCSEKPLTIIEQKLFTPALQLLGFKPIIERRRMEDSTRDVYRLFSSATLNTKDVKPLALCIPCVWGRNLDGMDSPNKNDKLRDTETPEENPGAFVVSLLDSGEADWAIVTNGISWRLYSAKAHSRATNYYEIFLPETLEKQHSQEAFPYFWHLFRASAFQPVTRSVAGESRSLSLLDDLLLESDLHARDLGEKLKTRIFEQIFPNFAEGFVNHARQQGMLPANLEERDADERNRLLEPYFTATLTFLYRLLFLFYAESRDLLPVRQEQGYYQYSLQHVKQKIADDAGILEDKVAERLSHYSNSETRLYDRLQTLFAAIDKGSPDLNIPVYNGGLFLTTPLPYHASEPQEITVARFLQTHKIPDRQLALGLDRMARDVDEKLARATRAEDVNRHAHQLIFIDYKSLGVRHLGSIYEGLLEFKLRIAPEEMAVVKGKRTDEIIPLSEAQQANRKPLKDKQGRTRLYAHGSIYLENDRRERKATGSYYTPDYIVKYIVEQTVGPVLQEKLDTLVPVFREAQRTLNTEQSKARQLKSSVNPEHETYKQFRVSLNEAFFDLKVLDPAMGSGHFLVEAVDYITDQMAKVLTRYKWSPILYELATTRQKIQASMTQQGVNIDSDKLTDLNLLKRRVLKSCIYGVDLNPMAVELAKVSLWLDCFTLGAPLSFLDHHLKCGNSLIGADVQKVREAITGSLVGWQFDNMLEAAQIMRKVGKLSDATAEEVAESRTTYYQAADQLAPYKRVLNVWLSEYFGNKNARKTASDYVNTIIDDTYTSINKADKEAIEAAQPLAANKRFFHWQLEFPEVFYDDREYKEDGGFDAVIGNPPYGDILDESTKQFLIATNFPKTGGRAEIYSIFLLTLLRKVALNHPISFIIPNTLLDGAQFANLRKVLTIEAMIVNVKDYRALPVFEGVNVQTMVIVLKHVSKSSIYETSYEYWDINQFKKNKLLVDTGSDAPWHLQNIVIQRISTSGLCLSLEPNIGTCHDAGVDYKWKGIGWQNRGDSTKISTLLFYEGQKLHLKDYPILKGADIDRYSLDFNDNWLIHDFAKYKSKNSVVQVYLNLALVPAKVLSRQTSDRIQSCVDYGQYVTAKSIHTTIVKAKKYNPAYVSCILNSKLLSYIYQLQTGESGRLFAQVKLYDFRELPIRRINFITSDKDRAYYLDKAKLLYQQCVSKNDEACVLGFVEHHLSKEPEESDVIHDLLAFLAEQMLDLNKRKRAMQRKFLDWLVETLRVLPDKNGEKVGIEVLTGKSKLQEYAGDYQKGEQALSPDELWEIVVKNRSHLGVRLTLDGLKERVQSRYQKSLEDVLPLKEQLRRTDALIDKVVYRLYGLTEEEIAVVEGKG